MRRSVSGSETSYKEQKWYQAAREFMLYAKEETPTRTFNCCFLPSSGRLEDHPWFDDQQKEHNFLAFFHLLKQDISFFLPAAVRQHIHLIIPKVLQGKGDYYSCLIAWYIELLGLMRPIYALLFEDKHILAAINKRFPTKFSGELTRRLLVFELACSMDMLIEAELRSVLINYYGLAPEQHAFIGQQIVSFFNKIINQYMQEVEKLLPAHEDALNVAQFNLLWVMDLFEGALINCHRIRENKQCDLSADGRSPVLTNLFKQFDGIVQVIIQDNSILFQCNLLEMLGNTLEVDSDVITRQGRDFFRGQLSAPLLPDALSAVDTMSNIHGFLRLYNYARFADNQVLLRKVVKRVGSIYRAEKLAMKLYAGEDVLGLNAFINEMLTLHHGACLQNFFSCLDGEFSKQLGEKAVVFRIRCRLEFYLLGRAPGCLSYFEFQNSMTFFKRNYKNVETAFILLDLVKLHFKLGGGDTGSLFEAVRSWMDKAQSYGLRGRSQLNELLLEILPVDESPVLQV